MKEVDMSANEYVILFVGFALVAISLFMVDRRKSKNAGKAAPDTDVVFSDDELQKITNKVNDSLDSVVASHLFDTDNKLSAITNEKIITIGEYTDQLFAKLDNNHQEVIFLYNMLQEKEEEMKSTLNRMEVVRKEYQAFLNKVVELRNQKAKTGNKRADNISNTNEGDGKGKSKSYKDEPSVETNMSEGKEYKPGNDKHGVNGMDAPDTENKNERILELYRDKKSLVEISRMMGIGQGEVKLVIDLYAEAR